MRSFTSRKRKTEIKEEEEKKMIKKKKGKVQRKKRGWRVGVGKGILQRRFLGGCEFSRLKDNPGTFS